MAAKKKTSDGLVDKATRGAQLQHELSKCGRESRACAEVIRRELESVEADCAAALRKLDASED